MTFKEYKDSFGNYYQLSNSKDSPVTIFIHGVGLDNTMWYPQKKFFSSKPILFYDLINHGQSVGGFRDLNFDIFSKQLLNLINELKLEKVNIVGFSIGALIAQHFTERFYNKVNKLVLIASVFKRSEDQIKTVQNRYNEALNGSSITEDSINRWFSRNFLKNNPETYNFFYKLLEKKNNDDFLSAYKVFVESDKHNLDYVNFNMPTLIMTGENEIGSTPMMSENINKEISGSELYIIKNAKHGATIEQAHAVNKKLNNFLF
tara:strand:+ start:129 stop:911 length:783 start_codon:yes stop_codon:yes gene_type:complete